MFICPCLDAGTDKRDSLLLFASLVPWFIPLFRALGRGGGYKKDRNVAIGAHLSSADLCNSGHGVTANVSV